MLRQTPPQLPAQGIRILKVGKGWLAVEKPAGLSVHNDPGKDLCALAANLMGRPAWWDPAFGLHAVHRLDRATSGVIVLAGQKDVLAFFGTQFQTRKVKKRYHAILHGHFDLPDAGPADFQAQWDWPLSKTATGRKNVQGPGARRAARTRCRILTQTTHYTLVALSPDTGRRHQLRRHAALAGHPMVGDKRYGPMRAVKYLERHPGFTRLALHAHSLTLSVPEESHPLELFSAGMPPDMQQLLDQDR